MRRWGLAALVWLAGASVFSAKPILFNNTAPRCAAETSVCIPRDRLFFDPVVTCGSLRLFQIREDFVGSRRCLTAPSGTHRLDNKGEIMDAHDGTIQQFGGKGDFYIHAVSYGDCKAPTGQGCDRTADQCGFQYDHNISIYTSPDLSSGSWVFKG
jgi:hypothetical protein